MVRGLGGVQLVISDAHTGLEQATAAFLLGAAWQRCRVHFLRNYPRSRRCSATPRTTCSPSPVSHPPTFPNPEALLRLAGAVLVEAHEEWQTGDRRYLAEGSMAQISGAPKAPATSELAAA